MMWVASKGDSRDGCDTDGECGISILLFRTSQIYDRVGQLAGVEDWYRGSTISRII
jgi:hypothetical protein